MKSLALISVFILVSCKIKQNDANAVEENQIAVLQIKRLFSSFLTEHVFNKAGTAKIKNTAAHKKRRRRWACPFAASRWFSVFKCHIRYSSVLFSSLPNPQTEKLCIHHMCCYKRMPASWAWMWGLKSQITARWDLGVSDLVLLHFISHGVLVRCILGREAHPLVLSVNLLLVIYEFWFSQVVVCFFFCPSEL